MRMTMETLRGKALCPEHTQMAEPAATMPADLQQLPNSTGCQWSTGDVLGEEKSSPAERTSVELQQLLCLV